MRSSEKLYFTFRDRFPVSYSPVPSLAILVVTRYCTESRESFPPSAALDPGSSRSDSVLITFSLLLSWVLPVTFPVNMSAAQAGDSGYSPALLRDLPMTMRSMTSLPPGLGVPILPEPVVLSFLMS